MGQSDVWQPGVAIVTGASAGLGRAYSVELGRAGHGSDARGATGWWSWKRQLVCVRGAGGRCEVVVGDVTEPGLAEDVVAQTEATLGPVDMLVANAGLLGSARSRTSTPICGDVSSRSTWWRRCCGTGRYSGMRARGRGRIVNLTSVASLSPQPYGSAYAAAKVGLNQLTASLAAEVAQDGIVVIALSPAAHTDMGRQVYDNDVLPEPLRDRLRAFMATDPDGLMRRSIEIFRFVMAGGADALTGQIVGVQPDRSETVEDLRDRAARKRAAMTGV